MVTIFLPGFCCATGEAIGLLRDEWEQLCKGLTIKPRDGFVLAINEVGQTQFEIYAPKHWFSS